MFELELRKKNKCVNSNRSGEDLVNTMKLVRILVLL